MKILVSACLIGKNCRYSGDNNYCHEVAQLGLNHQLILVCPEQLGGLPTPREPAERKGAQVLTKSGEDVTKEFQLGARETLKLATEEHCTLAILKAKSPSCGCGLIYDGMFHKKLIVGNGITTELLMEHGIKIINEKECHYFENIN